jgi:hypothetical protein
MSRKNDKTSMIKILQVIATQAQPSENPIFDSEFPQSKLNDLAGVSQKTVVDTLVKLENREYIKLSRKEPSTKGGKDKKFFTLTLSGFIHALINNPQQQEIILHKYPNMLLIAKKLPLFESIGLKQTVLDCFSEFLLGEVSRAYFLNVMGGNLKYPSFNVWKNDIDSSVLFLLLAFGKSKLTPKQYDALVELCKSDSDLNSLVKEIVRKENKRLSETMSFLAEWENVV